MDAVRCCRQELIPILIMNVNRIQYHLQNALNAMELLISVLSFVRTKKSILTRFKTLQNSCKCLGANFLLKPNS